MICLDKTCLIDLDVFLSISLSFYWSTNYSLFLFLATRVFVNDKQESNGTHVKNNLFFFFFVGHRISLNIFYQIIINL